MKKKALATKMAAFVMAGAMTMAMGFPAFAESKSIPFYKTIVDQNSVTDNSYIQNPNTSFEFVLADGAATTLDVKNEKGQTVNVPVLAGLTKDVEGNKELIGITYDKTLTVQPGEKTATGHINVDFDKFYSYANYKPGIYHYTLEEKSPAEGSKYDGMVYSQVKYDVYVFVYGVNAEDANSEKNAIVVAANGTYYGEGKTSKVNFDNTYTTYNLDVKKIVDGNQGDQNKPFTFTIGVTGAAGEKYYYSYCDENGNPTGNKIELTSGTSQDIPLKHNEMIRIYGLSANDSYTVTEASYTNDGYETKYVLNGGTAVENNSTTGSLSTDGHIVYTNTKSITTPTGIVTEYAPYILLVAAAGAFAVLFLRRKKEEF